VPVQLSAQGIEIVPARVCRANVGYFVLSLERTGGAGCIDPSFLEPAGLSNGAFEFDLLLPAGTYLLTAQIVNATNLAYQPEVSDRVRFTVEGPPPSFDGGACP
jgi:hypothetical protein